VSSEFTYRPPAGDDQEDRSIGELISAVSQDFSTLLRQELELAKAEVRESATRAGAGVGLLSGAGVAAHMVLLFLSIAAWWGIAQWTGQAWSGVIIAVIWAIVALILYTSGRSRLSRVEGIPRTMETTKQIPDALAGKEDS
jgi:Putative Actinobacterial Holin-X, holin superfamily III